MDCKERNYGLITEILAYNEGDLILNIPTTLLKKYVETSDFTIRVVTEQPDPETVTTKPVDGLTIPIRPNSAKLSESSAVARQGSYYTVSITWDADPDENSDYQLFDMLVKQHMHLLVTTFGGNKLLIYTSEDGWKFSYEDSEGIIKCNLSIMDPVGIRRLL